MSLFDWSDSHEMIGLLSEFVSDEWRDSTGDPARMDFLAGVIKELGELTAVLDTMDDDGALSSLRGILESASHEFQSDPVLVHLQACIEELERIRDQSIV